MKRFERQKRTKIYISQQDEATAGALGKCRSTVLREERVEYGILDFESKSSWLEAGWSAMLQMAGAGLRRWETQSWTILI